MTPFYIGNVIKSPDGSMWIVTGFHGPNDEIVEAVSFDSENCSAGQRLEDSVRKEWCEGCEKGLEEHWNGKFHEVKVKGWKHSQLLARNVKEFILKGMKKSMGID